MNELMLFEGNEVEIFEYEGKILFNPKHVAKCLDITDVKSSIRNFSNTQKIKITNKDLEVHSMHFRKLHNTDETFLTEAGVYKLIFKSRKEEAERFQDWVTDEVLPTIRKTGSYLLSNNLPTEVKQMLNCINKQQEQIDKLLSSTKEQQSQIDKIKQLVGIRAKQTFNYSQLIKNHNNARAISEVSWYEFRVMLEYKAKWYGREIVVAPSNYPSSQLCSECGYKNSDVKNQGLREWTCPQCNTHHHRDVNASKNLLKLAI